MPGPRILTRVIGNQRVNHQRFVDLALNNDRLNVGVCRSCTLQGVRGIRHISKGCAHAPDHQLWIELPQAGQRQLQLHPAFVAHQFMPFINHHYLYRGELLFCMRSCQHQA